MSEPSTWQTAAQIDDPVYSTGDNDPVFYYGDIINAVTDPSYMVPTYDGPGFEGVRPAYLKITPTVRTRLYVRIRTGNQDADSLYAGLYEHDQFGWSGIVDVADDPAPAVVLESELEAGHDYYVVMAFATETLAQQLGNYYWSTEVEALDAGGGSTPGPSLDAPPFAVGMAIAPGIGGVVDPGLPTDIVPITVAVGFAPAATFDGQILLSAPADGSVIVTDVPDFMVGVDVDDDSVDFEYTVEVQYADNSDFTSAITLTSDALVSDGGAILTPANPVPGTTYWRARVVPEGALPSVWADFSTFTVNAAVTAVNLPVSWTVSAAAARPIHLWHVFPASPDVGDAVTIYGQGFPDTGKVTFGDTQLTTTSWKRVASSADNNGTDGVIAGDNVDPEHYEVVFTAPDDTAGDVLTVGS